MSISGFANRLTAPQPIERLELLRITAPLVTLGFLSSRFAHIEHWITEVGFVVPEHATPTYKQPLYIPPVPVWVAYLVVALTVTSGILVSVGLRTRAASGVFAFLLGYLALADRLEAFTVNKLGTVVALALFLSPAGARYGIDANRRCARDPGPKPRYVTWGNVRFFQLLLMTMYCASGIAKMRGDWLTVSDVIWRHLHDSYQTSFTYFLARSVPPVSWTIFQWATLAYETGAPVWFAWKKTRTPALFVGVAMHTSIGLMFGPVIWFSLLMCCLLFSCFAPLAWQKWMLERLWESRAPEASGAPRPI